MFIQFNVKISECFMFKSAFFAVVVFYFLVVFFLILHPLSIRPTLYVLFECKSMQVGEISQENILQFHAVLSINEL